MGVVYKLKPEIKEFIIEKKQSNPILSCRGMVGLVEDNFNIKLSKSTINSIIKAVNLSSPVGRRRKKRRRMRKIEILTQIHQEAQKPLVEVPVEPPQLEQKVVPLSDERIPQLEPEQAQTLQVEPPQLESQLVNPPIDIENLGVILFKSADYILGGTHHFMEEIKRYLNQKNENTLINNIESIIYEPLLGSSQGLYSYLTDLQQVKELPASLSKIISEIFLDISGIKFNLSNNSVFYIDGQLYTVWSTPYIPSYFSSTPYNIRCYVNKYLKADNPFVLFTAPGYEQPTKEFFEFMSSLEGAENRIASLSLYGDKLKESEVIVLPDNRKRYFIFGLWPWQFIKFRKVNKIGEFRPFIFEPLNLNLYIADVDIELSQPDVNKRFILIGCAIKLNPNDKIRLLVLTNLPYKENQGESMLNLYLNRWPNLEETFQDYSRKIEFFSYSANSRHFLSKEDLPAWEDNSQGIKSVFEHYFKILDYYVRWHFLPFGYENQDFSTVKEQFYSLKVKLDTQQKDIILVKPEVTSTYPYYKELDYACHRINEREIMFGDNQRLWLILE